MKIFAISAAICGVAMFPASASASQSLTFEGTTLDSITVPKTGNLGPSFVLKGVSYDISYAFGQTFTNTAFDPFTFTYQGYIGSTFFGGATVSGTGTANGPGLISVGDTIRTVGTITNLDSFIGAGSIVSTLAPVITVNDARLTRYGFSQSATYKIVYEVDSVSPVPEPKAWLMMLTGFALLGSELRYRRRGIKVAAA